MKRRTAKMTLEISYPANKSAAWARTEVRNLIKHGVGYYTNAGDPDGVKTISLQPVRK